MHSVLGEKNRISIFTRYYTVSDHPDLSDVGDLSWDEGDLPHQEIKVANVTFQE